MTEDGERLEKTIKPAGMLQCLRVLQLSVLIPGAFC